MGISGMLDTVKNSRGPLFEALGIEPGDGVSEEVEAALTTHEKTLISSWTNLLDDFDTDATAKAFVKAVVEGYDVSASRVREALRGHERLIADVHYRAITS